MDDLKPGDTAQVIGDNVPVYATLADAVASEAAVTCRHALHDVYVCLVNTSGMSNLVWTLYISLFALSVPLILRNMFVGHVRMALLNIDADPRIGVALVARLPEYGAMMLNPRYWLLWTSMHWMAWINRNTDWAAEAAKQNDPT